MTLESDPPTETCQLPRARPPTYPCGALCRDSAFQRTTLPTGVAITRG
jgi:hypothetical protein